MAGWKLPHACSPGLPESAIPFALSAAPAPAISWRTGTKPQPRFEGKRSSASPAAGSAEGRVLPCQPFKGCLGCGMRRSHEERLRAGGLPGRSLKPKCFIYLGRPGKNLFVVFLYASQSARPSYFFSSIGTPDTYTSRKVMSSGL